MKPEQVMGVAKQALKQTLVANKKANGNNIFDPSIYVYGWYNPISHVFASAPESNCTFGLIPVTKGDILCIGVNRSMSIQYNFFDANFNHVSGNATLLSNLVGDKYIVVDNDSYAYFALNFNPYFSPITSITNVLDQNKDYVKLLDYDNLMFGKYSGSPITFTANTTDLIKVFSGFRAGDILKIKVYNNIYIYNYVFLDDNNTVLGGYKPTTVLDDPILDVVVPSGVTKVAIATPLTHLDNCWIKKYQVPTKTQWYGKTGVTFGTSIPAGYGSGLIYDSDPDSYPMLMADILNMIMVNEAVGSSCVCARSQSLVSVDNPYGFVGNFEAVSRCLGNTIEEMNWVIANWNNATVFTSNVPAEMTTDLQNRILAYSYENKLLKHLGNSNRKDVYIFEHGHNDSNTDNFTSIPTDKYDRFTYMGAMNYLIRLIYNDTPKAKVVILSHYENQLNSDIVVAQKNVADYWGIPFLALYDKLNWNQVQLTTTGYWDTYQFWQESGGTSQNLTMRQMWIYDNLHPHSDKSGRANRHIAKQAAELLKTVGCAS